MNDKRDFIYTLPESVLFDNSLTLVDLKIYLIIRSFMDTRGEAYPSNAWIANKLEVDDRTVRRSLGRLEERGHAMRIKINGRRHLIIGKPIPAQHLTSSKSYTQGRTQMSGGEDTNVRGGEDTNVHQLDQNNIISKIITYEDKKSGNESSPKRAQKPNIKKREEALTFDQKCIYERLLAIKGLYRGAAIAIMEKNTIGEINNVLEMAFSPNADTPLAYLLGSFFKNNEEQPWLN